MTPGHLLRRATSPRRSTGLAVAMTIAAHLAVDAEASHYSNLVLSHDPVAYWRLGELSGSTAYDAAGPNHGAYQNNVTKGVTGAIAGDPDTAADFGGGSNDRVQVPGFGVSGSGITMLAWFKPNSFGDRRFVSKATSINRQDHHWMLGTENNSSLKARVRISGTTRELQPSVGTMSAGTWYFAAVTYDGSTMRVYFNGELVGSGSWSGTVSTNSSVAVGLGNQPTGAGDRAFNGVLDEIAVFDTALSATDIANLYLAAGGGLVAHWKLDETDGTTAFDSSPNEHDATYQNNVTPGVTGVPLYSGNTAAHFGGGSNDRVQGPAFDVLGSGITIAAWFQPDEFGDMRLVSKATNTSVSDHWWMLGIASDSQMRARIKISGTTRALNPSISPLSPGTWYHAAVTYDGSTMRVYLNGELVGSGSWSGSVSTGSSVAVALGNQPSGAGDRAFLGALDDVRVYSRALSQSEIVGLYGLVGHWRLDESTGTTATDATPIANHGTYHHGVALAAAGPYPGAGANAASFDGDKGYVSVPKQAAYDITDTITVAGWFKVNSFDKNYQTLIAKGDTAWRLSRWGTQDVLHFACNGLVPNQVNGTTNVNDGRWHHFVCTYDGSQLSMYLNGVLDASVSATGTMSTNDFNVFIAANAERPNREFNGALHDLRVYNRALSAAEIAQLYGLIGHWKLDEGSGTAAADSSGMGNDGTITGSASWTTGTVDGALSLSNGGRVTVPSLLEKPESASAAAWANLSARGPSGSEVISLGDYFAIRLDEGSPRVFKAFGWNGSNWSSISVDAAHTSEGGGWRHYAAAFCDDDNTFTLYIDGVQVAATTTTSSLNYSGLGAATTIGVHGNGQTNFNFTGSIDDVRVYNRALSADEALQLFEMGSGNIPASVRIIRWVEIQ